MSTALDLVYQYRQLAGKCDARGLTLDEIDRMSAIEALFRSSDPHGCPRRFSRRAVDITASVRGRGNTDPIRIDNLGPGGLVCLDAPYFEHDDRVEILVDDAAHATSYRFKGAVTWVRVVGDDYAIGVRFIGSPLLLRFPRSRARGDVASAA